MIFRAYSDNVLVELEPLPTETEGGLVIPDMGKKDARRKATAVRWAKVLAVGPGHRPGCRHCGGVRDNVIPTELIVGDRVLVDALAGQDYSADLTVPRHHGKALNFDGVAGYTGELRVVREGEVLGLDEDVRLELEGAMGPMFGPLRYTQAAITDRVVPRWPCEDSGVE